jgi:hypothetical protein
MMSSALLNSTTDAMVLASASALLLAGAPRHAGPVVLSFTAGNYSKWAFYMKAILGQAGLIGHIDNTTVKSKTNAAWSTSDYTVLNILHAAINDDIADIILVGDQTARQLWLAARDLFSANKANKAIYLDNEFWQLL